MKKLVLVISLLFLLTAILFAGSRFWDWRSQTPGLQDWGSDSLPPLDYTSHILRTNSPVNPSSGKVLVASGITSHHLPTAEGFINQMYQRLYEANPDIKRFVVAGPDHFERCKTTVSVTTRGFLSPFGSVENDQEITKALLNAGAGEDNACFEKEHSIGVQVTFIKKYFPDAKIAGVIFSSAVQAQTPKGLAQVLAEKFPGTVVIGSVDFSHYGSFQEANQIDVRTEEQLKSMDVGSLRMEQMDSPASVRFVVAYASLLGAVPGFISHANSFEFTNQPDNTTSYFNVLYEK